MSDAAHFSTRLLRWFDAHGRHDLPWQHPRSPYRVWLAEVMLQQTQVATVIPYFERFVARFPDWAALAAADIDEVLQHWAGLGYYARGRNLHRAAQQLVAEHGGEVPRDIDELMTLPGLGRSTAAAILSQAYGERHAILDGNVRRVLARHAGIEGWPGLPAITGRLWREAEDRLPPINAARARQVDYAQAIMDLGATLCTARKPACLHCPVAEDCVARIEGRVAELPSPRPKRDRPQRATQALIVENAEGAVLLERRPPAGLWGGLWCLPLFEPDEDWREGLRTRYGLVTRGEARTETGLRHAFTHFDLDIAPLRVRAEDSGTALRERLDLRWTRLDATPLPALPTPIARLLQRRS